MQLIIGIIIGICVWHYWPCEAEKVAVETKAIVHKSATGIADATKEKSTLDKIKDMTK